MFWKSKAKITEFEQVSQMAADVWLALPYEQRINTVKLFLEHDYPNQYPKYDWGQFVLVEDETEKTLREWIAKWTAEGKVRPPRIVVPMAMGWAVLAVGHYCNLNYAQDQRPERWSRSADAVRR